MKNHGDSLKTTINSFTMIKSSQVIELNFRKTQEPVLALMSLKNLIII